MPQRLTLQKASPWGAFFILVAVAACSNEGYTADRHEPVDPNCRLDGPGEAALVDVVYDGDTLRLRDGRVLRLIGIDTPELGRKGAADEPLGQKAKAVLTDLAGPGTRLTLRLGTDRRDKYDRLLGHGFLGDGTNLQREMLAQGLAVAMSIAPNRAYGDCYFFTEREARRAEKGIWSLTKFRPVAAASLSSRARGFHRVAGVVERVGESRSAVWLNLEGPLALRILRQDLAQFAAIAPLQLKGRQILAQGRIYKRRRELRMTIPHPAALEIVE